MSYDNGQDGVTVTEIANLETAIFRTGLKHVSTPLSSGASSPRRRSSVLISTEMDMPMAKGGDDDIFCDVYEARPRSTRRGRCQATGPHHPEPVRRRARRLASDAPDRHSVFVRSDRVRGGPLPLRDLAVRVGQDVSANDDALLRWAPIYAVCAARPF